MMRSAQAHSVQDRRRRKPEFQPCGLQHVFIVPGYLAAECREIWWQLEAESSLLLYGGGVASVAALALGYIMYKKCSRGKSHITVNHINVAVATPPTLPY